MAFSPNYINDWVRDLIAGEDNDKREAYRHYAVKRRLGQSNDAIEIRMTDLRVELGREAVAAAAVPIERGGR